MLRMSGFVNYIMVLHDGPCGMLCIPKQREDSTTAASISSFPRHILLRDNKDQ